MTKRVVQIRHMEEDHVEEPYVWYDRRGGGWVLRYSDDANAHMDVALDTTNVADSAGAVREATRYLEGGKTKTELTLGLIYGAEGADYPDVQEEGPYGSLADACAAVDDARAARLGGVMIVEDWVASDGESITTGKGRVVLTALSEVHEYLRTHGGGVQ